MKEIIIEEVISQKFLVEDDTNYEEIRQMYKDEKFILDNPGITQVNVLMNEDAEWVDLHCC